MNLPRIHPISKSEFEISEPYHQVFAHDNARRFAKLELPNTSFRTTLSWRSDLIEPSIIVDEAAALVWIGVDERFAALSFDGQIRLSSPLESPLLTILQFVGGIIVVCELAAIVMNDNCGVEKSIDFQEIPERVEVQGKHLKVDFIDGSTEEFSLER